MEAKILISLSLFTISAILYLHERAESRKRRRAEILRRIG